jgi:hypothetical protein
MKITQGLKVFFLLLWSLFSCLTIWSQNNLNFPISVAFDETSGLPKNCQWKEKNDLFLPFCSFSIPISKNTSVKSVNFNKLTTKTCSKPSYTTNTSNDWLWDYEVKQWRGQWTLFVFVHPIKLEKGKFEQLVQAELEIETTQPIDKRGAKKGQKSFADQSVLATGLWYQIAIAKDGIYKIDRNLLVELGINPNELNPQNINLYGNGGRLLSPDNSDFRPDDLIKNAIYIEGEADGQFNNNDYILFYGMGPDTWTLKFNSALNRNRWFPSKHYYSDSAYYYLKIDDTVPLRMGTLPNVTQPETHFVSSFQDFAFVENELINIGKAGREFYGESFLGSASASTQYNFTFPNITGTGHMEFGAVGKTIGAASTLSWTVGGTSGSANISPTGTSSTDLYASPASGVSVFTAPNSSISANFQFLPGASDANAWMDFVAINVSRELKMSGNQMRIRDTTGIAPDAIAKFDLQNTSSSTKVIDITTTYQPYWINVNFNNSTTAWKSEHDTLREFIAFNPSGAFTPKAIGKISNQNLHALSNIDLVIVTAPQHTNVAEQIAEIHRDEGQTVFVTTAHQIFHEFSSGSADVTGIRQFMKMLYEKANGDVSLQPKNLLLMGDGAYDTNRGLAIQNGYNVIVYESDYSLSPTNSYVSDDYFVMLTPDDDQSPNGYLDCGVGRIPASDANEGVISLQKIRAYLSQNTTQSGTDNCVSANSQNPYGPWRNVLTFVSDDQDGSGGAYEQVHLNSCDSLANIVQKNHPAYDISKIYLDAYTQQSTPGGERYPEAENAIKNRINTGTLLVTYVGHGGERGWAHERVLDIPTIQSFNNLYKLPVFLTATCELARFDDPSYKSAGELLIMNPNGGAIAMLTTTRIVYSGENFQMDLAFYNNAFNDATDPELTLGKINMLTKNGVSLGNDSKPNFSLLGDPALKMNYPKFSAEITHINNFPITEFNDTLKALAEIKMRGVVKDNNGNLLKNFNGFVYPIVYDKPAIVTTQNNDGGVVQKFLVDNKILFKGKASVVNGSFEFTFPMPYDINYSVDFGRVSLYATSGTDDAHGSSQGFLVGGSAGNASLNQVGPNIELFMNDSTFVTGGVTNADPLLLAILQDENGINTAGNGIGHDLTAVLDAKSNQPVVLNEYFESDLDTYKKGKIQYPWNSLSTGNHTLTVKAWDTHNNSNTRDIEFIVAENAEMVIQHVLNYPNPFTTHTDFYFEHNQPCQPLEVTIQVFSISGKLVKTINTLITNPGYRSDGISWDGKDDFGDRIGKGVYVYRLSVKNTEGKSVEKFEKLVLLR